MSRTHPGILVLLGHHGGQHPGRHLRDICKRGKEERGGKVGGEVSIGRAAGGRGKAHKESFSLRGSIGKKNVYSRTQPKPICHYNKHMPEKHV
jgi:hypothetical protein